MRLAMPDFRVSPLLSYLFIIPSKFSVPTKEFGSLRPFRIGNEISKTESNSLCSR